MTDLATYEYDQAYVKQTEEALEQYEIKVKLLKRDIGTIVEHLSNAEKLIRIIADNYKLPEALGYFNNDAS